MFWPNRGLRVVAVAAGLSRGCMSFSAGSFSSTLPWPQMASPRGICVALLFHIDLHSWATFAIALWFHSRRARIFSVTGKRNSQVPQEAIIGIAYVVAAAAAVSAHRAARLKATRKSNRCWWEYLRPSPRSDVLGWRSSRCLWRSAFSISRCAAILLLVSFDRARAYEAGLRVRWWDFLFYAALRIGGDDFRRASPVCCWSSVI